MATSIVLSLISFALCYALINAGVDVQSLLQKVSAEYIDFHELQNDFTRTMVFECIILSGGDLS